MRKCAISVIAILLFFAIPTFAQENYTEGPVWRVALMRIKPPFHRDEYLAMFREQSKPFLDEQKKAGIILDYKFFDNSVKHDPQDWDLALAVQYKNFGALDGLDAREEALREKVIGSKQKFQELREKRGAMREIISVTLFREINLR